MTIDWPKFVEIVNGNNRFLLTSHIRPDCDALGSELGMAGILESLGKKVLIVNGQETPPNLAFIDPDQKIKALGTNVTAADLDDVERRAVESGSVRLCLDVAAKNENTAWIPIIGVWYRR